MSHTPNSPHARDIAAHLHPYTNLAVHPEVGPHILTRGEGIYVYDDEGNKFIEGMSGLWCASLGFSEKRLVRAARAKKITPPVWPTILSS